MLLAARDEELKQPHCGIRRARDEESWCWTMSTSPKLSPASRHYLTHKEQEGADTQQ